MLPGGGGDGEGGLDVSPNPGVVVRRAAGRWDLGRKADPPLEIGDRPFDFMRGAGLRPASCWRKSPGEDHGGPIDDRLLTTPSSYGLYEQGGGGLVYEQGSGEKTSPVSPSVASTATFAGCVSAAARSNAGTGGSSRRTATRPCQRGGGGGGDHLGLLERAGSEDPPEPCSKNE